MNAEQPLPTGFEDLARLVEEWCLPDEPTRYAKRLATPLDELRQFYDAIYPRMDDVLRYLAGIPCQGGDAAAPADRRLFQLALAYFEASHPVELGWKSQDLDAAFPAARIVYEGPSLEAD